MPEARPDYDAIVDQPAAYLMTSVCLSCRRPLSGDRDFGWWVHLETGDKQCDPFWLSRAGQTG